MVPIESLLRHDDFIRGLARNLLGRDSRAEDVAQDAWLAAAEGGPTSEATARGWFGRVVRNKVASLRRRDGSAERWRQHAPQPAGVPEPSTLLDREAMRSHVVDALLALDPIYRDCLVLRFYEGLKPREIAKRLDMPVESVRTRTRRGLDRMRSQLDERCGPRRRWLTALLPLAGRWRTPLWPRLLQGAAALAVVAVGVGCVLWLMNEPLPDTQEEATLQAIRTAPALNAKGRTQAPVVETAAELEPDAPPPWRVAGQLRWRNDNAPAEDVPLEVRLISGRKTLAEIGVTRTNADGTFELSLADLRDLSPATYSAASLFISTPGYQNNRWPPGESIPLRKLDGSAENQVIKVDLRLDRRENNYGHLMGILLGPDGERISDANIAAWRGDEGARTFVKGGTVNEVGDFDVPVGAGTYYSGGEGITEPEVLTIIAEVPGLGRVVREGIHAHPKRDQWIGELRLEPLPHATRVRFELGDGSPLAGVEVLGRKGQWTRPGEENPMHSPCVHERGIATLRTDAEGTIVFRAKERTPWSLWLARPRASAYGDTPFTPELEFTAGDADTRVVVDAHVVRVRLLDEKGRPAAGAQWLAKGWPADRRDRAERTWERTVKRSNPHVEIDGTDEPTWRLDHDASRLAGPATGTLEEIVLIGDPGSEWIISAWTSGFHRGLARVTIPKERTRSEAALQLARIEPSTIRIEIKENGEPSDAEFRYYGHLSSTRGTALRGVLRHGTTLKDLIPGDYSLTLTSGTHHVSTRHFSVDATPGKPATVTIPVTTGGKLALTVDLPRHVVAHHALRGYLHATNLETKRDVLRARLEVRPDPKHDGVLADFRTPGHRNHHPFTFLPGRYRIQARFDEWTSEAIEIDITADAITTTHLRLDPVEK